MDPSRQTYTGGCQCGAVRYEAAGPPSRTHFCHCRMCQKALGNLFAALAPFKRADVVDWMYTEADTRIMHGNFTTCAQLSHAPESDVREIKKRYGLDCTRGAP